MKHPVITWETIVLLSWTAAILPPRLYRGVGRQATLDGVDLLREGFFKILCLQLILGMMVWQGR